MFREPDFGTYFMNCEFVCSDPVYGHIKMIGAGWGWG